MQTRVSLLMFRRGSHVSRSSRSSRFSRCSHGSLVAFALIALSASGCVYGEMRQVLRAQVAAELKCPEVAVKQNLPFQEGYKENQYRLEGCGVTRTYECPPTKGLISYDNKVCTYVAGDTGLIKMPTLAKDPNDAMNEEPAPVEPAPAEPAPAAKPEPKPSAKPEAKQAPKAEAKQTSKAETKAIPKPSGRFTGKLSIDTNK